MLLESLLTNPNITPQEFITQLLKKEDFLLDSFTPDKKFISDSLVYQKTKHFGILPKTIKDIKVEGLNVLTHSNSRFLLFDITYKNGTGNGRAIGFSSDEQLHLLQQENIVLLGDGTFKYVPNLFCQLYTFHVVINGTSFPVLFIYMQHRTKEAYKSILSHLNTKFSINVSIFMSDFEKSIRSSVKEVFGNSVVLKGCWFHFLQCIMKKLGLGKEYSTDTNVNMFIRKLFSLAFIPPLEICDLFRRLKYLIVSFPSELTRTKLYQLTEYFYNTWIKGTKYNVSDWNQLNDVGFKTNNWSEAFHSSFAKRFNRSNPNIYLSFQILRDVENEYRYNLNQFKNPSLRMIQRISIYEQFTNQLKDVISKRDIRWKDNDFEYLDALSSIREK